MAHFKRNKTKKREGKIVYGDKIVNGIVYQVLSEIPYVELYSTSFLTRSRKKSICVYTDKEGVHIEVYVKVYYSQSVSDTAFKIQEAVRHNVETMVDYHVSSVDVIVKGILFDKTPSDKTLVDENKSLTDDFIESDKIDNGNDNR